MLFFKGRTSEREVVIGMKVLKSRTDLVCSKNNKAVDFGEKYGRLVGDNVRGKEEKLGQFVIIGTLSYYGKPLEAFEKQSEII